MVRLGESHAVEQGQRAVAMAQKSQHGDHAVDGVEERLRHRLVARRECVAQWQNVEQEIDQRLGIAPDMAAVGEDLAGHLLRQRVRGALQGRLAEVGAERKFRQRDPGEQTLLPGGVAGAARERRRIPGQPPHERAVKVGVRAGQHEGSLAEP